MAPRPRPGHATSRASEPSYHSFRKMPAFRSDTLPEFQLLDDAQSCREAAAKARVLLGAWTSYQQLFQMARSRLYRRRFLWPNSYFSAFVVFVYLSDTQVVTLKEGRPASPFMDGLHEIQNTI